MKNIIKILLVNVVLIIFIDLAFGQEGGQTVNVYLTEQDSTDKDTVGEKLLISGTWQTCALIDSINQYYKIQFVKKELIDSIQNCTAHDCAYSEWTFKDNDNEKTLEITNFIGCPEDVINWTSIGIKWMWKYDKIGRVIKLFDENGVDKYHLLIAGVNKNRLFIITFKADLK